MRVALLFRPESKYGIEDKKITDIIYLPTRKTGLVDR